MVIFAVLYLQPQSHPYRVCINCAVIITIISTGVAKCAAECRRKFSPACATRRKRIFAVDAARRSAGCSPAQAGGVAGALRILVVRSLVIRTCVCPWAGAS